MTMALEIGLATFFQHCTLLAQRAEAYRPFFVRDVAPLFESKVIISAIKCIEPYGIEVPSTLTVGHIGRKKVLQTANSSLASF